MPLPVLASPRAGTMVYGLAAIDPSGRIADRTVIRALGWGPGTRLHIREGSGVIVVRLDRQGVFTVTGQGHLHLPAAVRHWCGLTAGDGCCWPPALLKACSWCTLLPPWTRWSWRFMQTCWAVVRHE
ncbi:hypothetical protein [Micromonospora citrea]|uniref:hypothetical protein n=1 Tax=Micromonospora citrea TaxID=47855 RepID=UPI001C407A73|nr:hypothetical protein [Micromonospora citrea]